MVAAAKRTQGGKGGVYISYDYGKVWPFVEQDFFVGYHDTASLFGVGAAANTEIDMG
ncbi:unnamed protein product, partial [marine sediment metagenome]